MDAPQNTTVPTGRRERNKQDTHRAITDAALALARTHGLGEFTAEQIAEHAGVSRRTFFNYFHSAEEALNVSTESFLDAAVEHFSRRPPAEPLLDSMIAALTATTKVQDISVHGELFRMAEGNPDLLRAQLLAWERAEARIIRAVGDRLGGRASDLYVSALVGSVLSCARAALQDWAAGGGDATREESNPVRGAGDPARDAGADLEARMVTAISMLRDGFSRLG